MVQWLRLHTSTAGGTGSIPGWETKTSHAEWHGQKKKRMTRQNAHQNSNEITLHTHLDGYYKNNRK